MTKGFNKGPVLDNVSIRFLHDMGYLFTAVWFQPVIAIHKDDIVAMGCLDA